MMALGIGRPKAGYNRQNLVEARGLQPGKSVPDIDIPEPICIDGCSLWVLLSDDFKPSPCTIACCLKMSGWQIQRLIFVSW